MCQSLDSFPILLLSQITTNLWLKTAQMYYLLVLESLGAPFPGGYSQLISNLNSMCYLNSLIPLLPCHITYSQVPELEISGGNHSAYYQQQWGFCRDWSVNPLQPPILRVCFIGVFWVPIVLAWILQKNRA